MVVPSEEIVSNDYLIFRELNGRAESRVNGNGEIAKRNISGGGRENGINVVLHFRHHRIDLALNLSVDHMDEVINNLFENTRHVSRSIRNSEIVDTHGLDLQLTISVDTQRDLRVERNVSRGGDVSSSNL